MESRQRKQAGQRSRYSDEFRAGAVCWVLEQGKRVTEAAADLAEPGSVIKVKQARIVGGKGPTVAPTDSEKTELSDVPKKVKTFEMEKALLNNYQ